MFRAQTVKPDNVEAEAMGPSQEAVVREGSERPGLGVEAGIGHANDEHARSLQDAMRLGKRNARSGELLEAIPDEHGVERFGLEAALVERTGTYVESARPREAGRIAADVHA